MVRLTRLELAQPFGHYHLKVACIPISPQAHKTILPHPSLIPIHPSVIFKIRIHFCFKNPSFCGKQENHFPKGVFLSLTASYAPAPAPSPNKSHPQIYPYSSPADYPPKTPAHSDYNNTPPSSETPRSPAHH